MIMSTGSEEMRRLIDIITKIHVRHMDGSSEFKTIDSSPWKEFWSSKSGKPLPNQKVKCPCCGEETDPADIVGAHVVECSNANKKYICLTCNICNDTYGEEKEPSKDFWVKKADCVVFDENAPEVVRRK